MGIYIHVPTNQYPVDEWQIKAKILAETPNVSFAKPFVPPSEYVKVEPTEQPTHDSIYQTVVEAAPMLVGGVWTQQWSVRDATRDEVLSRIPSVVTMRQGRLALLHFGLLDAVDAAIAGMTNEAEKRAAQIEWEYAQEIDRNSPWVQNLSGALGLSESQLDELFKLAANL